MSMRASGVSACFERAKCFAHMLRMRPSPTDALGHASYTHPIHIGTSRILYALGHDSYAWGHDSYKSHRRPRTRLIHALGHDSYKHREVQRLHARGEPRVLRVAARRLRLDARKLLLEVGDASVALVELLRQGRAEDDGAFLGASILLQSPCRAA